MSVTVANTEQMSLSAFPEVRVQDETVLVLLSWVSWHETDSCCKCILSDYIVLQMARGLAYVCMLHYLLRYFLFDLLGL